MSYFYLILAGIVIATGFQVLQKYTKSNSFFHVTFFLILAILSVLTWMISLAAGGWTGISLTSLALNALILSISVLCSSFILSFLTGSSGKVP
jgi:hypothetical protein